MWIRRILAVVVILGVMLLGWGTMVDLRGMEPEPATGFTGWGALVQQSVLWPGLVTLVAALGWVVAMCVWLFLMSAGKARRNLGWDIGLVGLWVFCTAVWVQVFLIAYSGFGSDFRYSELGFGYWLFLLGLFVSIAIRFTGAVFEMILEIFSAP